MTEIEMINRRLYDLSTEVNTLRLGHNRISNIVEGLHGEDGLQDVVKEIAVSLASLEKMMKLVTYLAVPLAVLSLLISFSAVVVSVIALNNLP